MEGKMLWFNPAKEHGFIRTEEGERLRVDESGFESGHAVGDRCRGMKVSFERVVVDEDPRAVNVVIVPFEVPHRARLRGRG